MNGQVDCVTNNIHLTDVLPECLSFVELITPIGKNIRLLVKKIMIPSLFKLSLISLNVSFQQLDSLGLLLDQYIWYRSRSQQHPEVDCQRVVSQRLEIENNGTQVPERSLAYAIQNKIHRVEIEKRQPGRFHRWMLTTMYYANSDEQTTVYEDWARNI